MGQDRQEEGRQALNEDFTLISFWMSTAILGLVLFFLAMVFKTGRVCRAWELMIYFVMLGMAVSGVVGALGRLVGHDPEIDRACRIILIALRVFIIGGLLNILWAISRGRRKTDS